MNVCLCTHKQFYYNVSLCAEDCKSVSMYVYFHCLNEKYIKESESLGNRKGQRAGEWKAAKFGARMSETLPRFSKVMEQVRSTAGSPPPAILRQSLILSFCLFFLLDSSFPPVFFFASVFSIIPPSPTPLDSFTPLFFSYLFLFFSLIFAACSNLKIFFLFRLFSPYISFFHAFSFIFILF